MSAPDPTNSSPLPPQPCRTPAPPADVHGGLRSPKITSRHLERLALVYVRQSTPQQVLEHRESRARQYGLADQAVALGWSRDRVVIIDEDQGQSGTSGAHRAGFQRLLAEVTLNHVGLVLGLEMSRLARSNKDWHHLLELCAVFQTLLADQDGVYDASDPNDRLLLGLKGTMSEVELVTMRNRLDRGKLHKAERGELFLGVPPGYVKLPSGQVDLDPDEQVRASVRLVLDKFEDLGTVWGVFRYLLRHDLRLSLRPRCGPARGQVHRQRPTVALLFGILRHPMYAGAYVYGRRVVDRQRQVAGHSKTGQRWLPLAEWKVLLRDRLPASITWERYVENQERMSRNRATAASPGVPRQGAALLGSLLRCGTCGRRLQVAYRSRGGAYYSCQRHRQRGTPQTCYGLPAAPVDELVAAQVVRALEPAALEMSLQAIQDVQKERTRLDLHWRQQLERARYEAQRAQRQYQAVEPENRLVARTLEANWEKALQEVRRLEEDYDRFLKDKPPPLSQAERARITALAADLPALWQAPTTTAADRKEVIRCLIERVAVDVRPDSEYVGVAIHWQGGFVSQHEVVRVVRTYAQLRDGGQLLERILQLRREGHSAARIAVRLNEEGFHSPKCRGRFSAEMVRQLLSRRGLANEKTGPAPPGPHEWWLTDLARELQLRPGKLRDWLLRGWVAGRRTAVQGLWIAWADDEELKRLRQLQARSQRGLLTHPDELINPKKKTDH